MVRFIKQPIFIALLLLLLMPILMIMGLAFYSFNDIGNEFTTGFNDLFSSLRLGELWAITWRAVVVSFIATITSFMVSYLLVRTTNRSFQLFFLTVITIPLLINESVRVFSWQYILSENGIINHFFSFLLNKEIVITNGSNDSNVYILLIIACFPLGVFINAASLLTIPPIFWRVADDLNLTRLSKFIKVAIPLSKFGIFTSYIVIFFIAFSLSSEVNFLGGATKISMRNFITSLMSASLFQTIFSLGLVIITILITFIFLFNRTSRISKQ